MRVLLDSNILLRSAQPTHSMHVLAKQATDELVHRKADLICIPQVCYEFWVVATRPLKDNGLGLDVQSADLELARLQHTLTFLNDSPLLYQEWLKLVKSQVVTGKRAHDARLVAAMNLHRVSHILTFNSKDFQGFSGITVLTPANVLSPSSNP